MCQFLFLVCSSYNNSQNKLEVTFTVGHFSWDTNSVTEEVVYLLAAFLCSYLIVNLHPKLGALGI